MSRKRVHVTCLLIGNTACIFTTPILSIISLSHLRNPRKVCTICSSHPHRKHIIMTCWWHAVWVSVTVTYWGSNCSRPEQLREPFVEVTYRQWTSAHNRACSQPMSLASNPVKIGILWELFDDRLLAFYPPNEGVYCCPEYCLRLECRLTVCLNQYMALQSQSRNIWFSNSSHIKITHSRCYDADIAMFMTRKVWPCRRKSVQAFTALSPNEFFSDARWVLRYKLI